MRIEDLTKALYFLNVSDYKYTLLIDKIDGGAVFFTNGKWMPVEVLKFAYDNYIKTGELMRLF